MIGTRLRELRESRNLSQATFAAAIGVNRGTYAHYEIDKRRPDYETLIKIADYYNVTTDYLLRGRK
jgi:transcriptional regulator with XRE-family HTH domain